MGFVSEEEKFKLLSLSDIFVSTSIHEGFGLVFLEAMTCGLPVVAYDCGGQVDFLRHDETGFLAPLNQIEYYSTCCRTLIENSELRQRIAVCNRKRVEEYYIERYAHRHEELFRETIELRRASTLATAPQYRQRWVRATGAIRGKDIVAQD
jgi:glycosyltransferase involved in cell wall biosynthesis